MTALGAALALAALAAAPAGEGPHGVRWIVGPASVELAEGRVRCDLPEGVALVSGASVRSILEVVAHGSDGSELAVLSPTAPSRTWYVVVAWREGARAGAPGAAGGAGGDRVVWIERPRNDERRGRTTWSVAGPGVGGPSVNRHVLVPAAGGALEVTLVTPVEELAEGRAQLDRIVDGIETAPAGARGRPGR